MSEPAIDPKYGRAAFGADPASHHATRPGYPDWVFETLRDRCGLTQGTATFEIGPGTGTATRRLLDLGAKPLVAIEPDARLASYLRETIPDEALSVSVAAFEDVALEPASFDLGVSATAFHWLHEDTALMKIADHLRSGGWWAAVWNVFGDNVRADPFHEATKAFLPPAASTSVGTRDIPFALDAEARVAALQRAGMFDAIEHRTNDWSLALDPDQTVALYATFSNINIRADREAILAELHRVARHDFHGRVTRNMTTSLYIVRRRPV
ncbi:MAG TPA: class I SAM-dependent methyltransferase [Acetobacteraceae bacterium]|jgi:SAM-dependent methyltransferase